MRSNSFLIDAVSAGDRSISIMDVDAPTIGKKKMRMKNEEDTRKLRGLPMMQGTITLTSKGQGKERKKTRHTFLVSEVVPWVGGGVFLF